MSWRVAKSLLKLRDQVNAGFPNRSKDSDGTIGNAEHSSRESDHNPDPHGVVCAMDITNDPLHQLSSEQLAEIVRRDFRVSYVISNKKISNPKIQGGAWRHYGGPNPHNHHCHISVIDDPRLYDDESPWHLPTHLLVPTPQQITNYIPPPPTIKLGSRGNAVMDVQTRLGKLGIHLVVDSSFGEETKKGVMQFQKSHGLHEDGIVGPHTWDVLKEATK